MIHEQFPQNHHIRNDNDTPPFGQPRGVYDWSTEEPPSVDVTYVPHLTHPDGDPVVGDNSQIAPKVAAAIIAESRRLSFPTNQIPTSGFTGGVVHDTHRRSEATLRAKPF